MFQFWWGLNENDYFTFNFFLNSYVIMIREDPTLTMFPSIFTLSTFLFSCIYLIFPLNLMAECTPYIFHHHQSWSSAQLTTTPSKSYYGKHQKLNNSFLLHLFRSISQLSLKRRLVGSHFFLLEQSNEMNYLKFGWLLLFFRWNN